MIRPSRLEDAEAIVDVVLATWETTYGEILPTTVFETRRHERQERIERYRYEFEHGQVVQRLVYEDNGQVQGFVVFGPSRESHGLAYPGEIYAIYILEAVQGKGIGKALLMAAFVAMAYDQVLIWALRENPNTGFYEHLGGKAILEKTISLHGINYDEIGFVFDRKAFMIRGRKE